jgi:hypothetical protein
MKFMNNIQSKKILFSLIAFFTVLARGYAQTSEFNTFFFGHSLVQYNSTERGVSYWMHQLGQAEGTTMSQQWVWAGPLEFHQIPPSPSPDHTYPLYSVTWDANYSNFNAVVLAEGNSKMTQPENHLANSITNALALYDYVIGQNPSLSVYLYEIWPHCQQYLGLWDDDDNWMSDAFKWTEYKSYALPGGEHLDYFIQMQDAIMNQRPDGFSVRLIPVSSIMAKMLNELPSLSSVTAADLFEDCGPHGYESAYFVAGLIHYMALREQRAPSSYTPPSAFIIQPFIDNYNEMVDYIWTELLAFNDNLGNSRVFINDIPDIPDLTTGVETEMSGSTLNLFPNPVTKGEHLSVTSENAITEVLVYNIQGKLILTYDQMSNDHLIATADLLPGVYFVKVLENDIPHVEKIIIMDK